MLQRAVTLLGHTTVCPLHDGLELPELDELPLLFETPTTNGDKLFTVPVTTSVVVLIPVVTSLQEDVS